MSALNRMLFAERQKRDKQVRAATIWWILCAVLAVSASHLAAFLIGDNRGYERGFAAGNAMPKRVVMVQPAQNLIQCDRSGLLEIQRICRGRKLAMQVKP